MGPSSPDVDVLLACLQFGAAKLEVNRLEIGGASDTRFGNAVDALDRAADTVARLSATTAEGLRTKAIVCRFVLAAEEPDATTSPPGGLALRHDVLAWSLLSDLLAHLASSAAPSPDAELLAACAAFDTVEHDRDAMFDDGTLTDEVNATLRAAQDLRVEQICTLRALTLPGLQARARSLLLFDDGFLERRLVHAPDRIMAAILRDLVEDGPAKTGNTRFPVYGAGEPVSCGSGPSSSR
ncbi:MAG: hypothetical protein ACRYG8_24460 [Janthinobacterium lividum]